MQRVAVRGPTGVDGGLAVVAAAEPEGGECRPLPNDRLTLLLGALPVAIALLNLAGWAFGIDALTRWVAGLPAMAPTTAVAFLVLGVAIASAERARADGSAAQRRLSLGAGALVVVIAGSILVAWVVHADAGPEHLLLYDVVARVIGGPDQPYAARTSPQGAASLLFLGLAVMWNAAPRKPRLAPQALAVIGATVVLIAVAGYIDGAVALFGMTQTLGLALPTAAGLLAAAAALVALERDHGMGAALRLPGHAGRLVRYLSLAAFAVPFGGALLLRGGELAGWYNAELRSGAFVALTALLLAGVVWRAARSLMHAEEEREELAAERARRAVAEALAEKLREQVAERAAADAEREALLGHLRESDRRKDEFLAMLSHELRNPLAPVRSALWLLDSGTGPEQATRARQVIARQVAHLGRIVDDLLDLTRVSRGKIDVRTARVDLVEIVRRTAEDHHPLFLAHDVTLAVGLGARPVWIEADGTRIAQAIGNLLQNAVKFTEAGGHVDVAVADEPDGTAVVCVRDDGIGIPPALLERIFEPFMQADESLHRTRGGVGLGLPLVKALVELHGGTAGARSKGKGLGAEFTIRLPVAAPPAAAPAPARTSGKGAHRRVLVVDDNVDAAETLREVLLSWGHEVEVAYDGMEGLAKARAFRPDVVLCDIGLPTVNGYEVAQALQADPALAGAVRVAVTGYARPEDRRRALEAGFHRHLGKPVELDQISDILDEAPRLAGA